jgi:hypothetical protein
LVEEEKVKPYNIFPNPTNSEINIYFKEAININFILYDSKGITIEEGSFYKKRKLKIGINQRKGIYFLKMTDPKGTICIEKVLLN